jgi:hypothetical protein
MNSDEAAAILGVDSDTIDDLEDLLDLDGRWTIAALADASEILDSDSDSDSDDADDENEAEDDDDLDD